jgi:NADPH2:quinone reductase
VRASVAWPVPDHLELAVAACIPIPFGTADDCLFEFGRLQAHESVLIHAGASGVGLAAIQLAKRAGATVLATASSDEKLERLKDYGLDHGINHDEGSFVKPVEELTGGGPDLVIDSVGGKNLERSLHAAGYRGRIVSMGSAGRDRHTPSLAGMMGQNKTLISYYQGAELSAPTQRERARANAQRLIDEVADDHRERHRHPQRQHHPHQPRRRLRPRPALPAARPRRPLLDARLLLPARLLPARPRR